MKLILAVLMTCLILGTRAFAITADKPNILVILADDLDEDLGETTNRAAAQPERVAKMKAALEEIIANGRGTPGKPQPNDVKVRRFPRGDAPDAKSADENDSK